MDRGSPFELVKELTNRLGAIVSAIDVDALPAAEREAVSMVKQVAVDARLEVRDYEYAGSRSEQQQSAGTAKKYLEQLQKNILKASEYNLFSASEVATLSARLQQVISGLE